MEKILFVINAVDLNQSALNFASYLASLTNSTLTGVFLENLAADEKAVVTRGYGGLYLDWQLDSNSPEFIEKQRQITANMSLFKETCERKGIRSNLHRDPGVPIKEILAESRFADLIVTDISLSFKSTETSSPSEFVQDLLQDAECPVIVAPVNFERIDEIIFTSNGSKSAMFAIKQFSYLLPELREKRAIVFQVNGSTTTDYKDTQALREWLQQRYSAVGFESPTGDVTDKLFAYLFKRKNCIIVMGAYGRSALSRFFKHSQADIILNTSTQPVFIAHY